MLLKAKDEINKEEEAEKRELVEQIDIAIAANIEEKKEKINDEKTKISKYKEAFQSLYAKAKVKANELKETIIGPKAMTSLLYLREEVARERGEQAKKLDEAKLKRAQQEKIAEVQVKHKLKENILSQKLHSLTDEAKLSPKVERRKKIRSKHREILTEQDDLDDEYGRTIKKLNNPLLAYLEDYHA